MIVEELVARLGFTVEGLDKLKRAAAAFQRLTRAVGLFAAAVARRLGRVAVILARVTAGLVKFGAGFIARASLITGAAALASAALARLAAGFAKVRQETIDSARIGGVPVKELALVESVMKRVGASAEDGRKFVAGFVEKLREGAKDGGDWAETLGKAGVKITSAKGAAKAYSVVIDDILKAADKIRDPEKKRTFLTEALEGAPDQLVSQLLGATSAFEAYKKIVQETAKTAGVMSFGDVLNAEDINTGMNRIQSVMDGFKSAFGSGLMASFSQEFRKLGEYLRDLPLQEIQANIRAFGGGLGDFLKDVTRGGFIVLGKVGEALQSIVSAMSSVNDATGGKFAQIATGLGLLVGAITVATASPLVAISAAITGILFAVQKFSEWKAGGINVLSDFFDTIAGAAEKAKGAVSSLLETLRSFPSLGSIISPAAPADGGPDGAGKNRRKAIEDGVNGLERLRQKQGLMGNGGMAGKIAGDIFSEQNNSFKVFVTANGLGEIAGAAANGVRAAAANIRMQTSTSGGAAP
jgi:hypothetical protein